MESLVAILRRYLACAAAALLLAQGTALSAAAVAYAGVVTASDDCCVKGSHPPGMCPLHRKPVRSTTDAAKCRLSCAASVQPLSTVVAAEPIAVQTSPVTLVPISPDRSPDRHDLLDSDFTPISPPPEAVR